MAVALLANPVGAYVTLVVAAASIVYGAHVRRLVPLFTGFAAGLLTVLAFMHAAPHALALALAAAGVALLDAEFRFATAGWAALFGLAALMSGSWLLLGAASGGWTPPGMVRGTLALTGSVSLLLATYVGWRRATLP
jgi:membrane-bound ClpP family serine protease